MRLGELKIGFHKSTKQGGKRIVVAFLLLFLLFIVVGLWENVSDAYSRTYSKGETNHPPMEKATLISEGGLYLCPAATGFYPEPSRKGPNTFRVQYNWLSQTTRTAGHTHL